MFDLCLKNGKVYRNNRFEEKHIYVHSGIIREISVENFPAKKVIECGSQYILPGFIDPHVHLSLELGEFTSVDDFKNGSKIAALGGITTVIDFLDPIHHEDAFEQALIQRKEKARDSMIDYSFHTTLATFKGDYNRLIQESIKKGLPSIKVFTTYEGSHRMTSYRSIYKLLQLSHEKEFLLLVHAEDNQFLEVPSTLETYAKSRSPFSEYMAFMNLGAINDAVGGKLYIVHSTCGSNIRKIKDKFSNVFIESCPQYFHLDETFYQKEDGNLFVLAPPLRSVSERKNLIKAIDLIDTIGTDHCSFRKEDKLKYDDITKVPKGIGSLEYSFTLMYTIFGKKVIDKYTINPAKIHGLYPQKGTLEIGTDADIVVFDPTISYTISNGESYAKYSPYEGISVTGKVIHTIRRGEMLVENSRFIGTSKGKFIRRQYESDKKC